MRGLTCTILATALVAGACSGKSAPTPTSFFADHFASYWIPCSRGEPCALPDDKRAGLSPALLERVLAVGAAYPDREAVTAASAALDEALATAGVPVLIDVQPWQDTTLLLAYQVVARHAWRSGDKTLPVVRVHRLDHTNIEPAWLGHAGREAPLVLLDKLEVALLENLRAQRATDGNIVDAAVRKTWRALAERVIGAATLERAVDALARRDELHEKLEDSFQSKRVQVPYPERLLLGEDYFERLSPYADPKRSGGPLFMRTDLKALRAADRALGEDAVLHALHALRDLEAGATEAHEVHHALHRKLDPSSVPADVMEALGDDDLPFGVATDGELRAYLGELHDAEAPPCLALGRVARILAGARSPRTPHHYAARVAFKHLHGGDWVTSAAAVAGAVEQLCALEDAALRQKAADAWTAIYREPMPVVGRAPGERRDAGPAATAQPPATARPTLFDERFAFACSPDPEVACAGVFPVRTPAASPASTVALLSHGEDALRARIASLRAARRSIRIQALIFRGDEAGLAIAELLAQKKAEGLDVRVIVDAPSNLDWQTQWMYFDLKRHGVEVEGYEALYLQWLTAEIVPTDPLRPNKRFHDKMWIVDGEDPEHAVAIVGGLNIANEYFRVEDVPLQRWRDQDVLLGGAVVGDVVRAFDRNYDFFKALKGRLPPIFNPDNAWRLARDVQARVGGARSATWRRPSVVAAVDRILSSTLDPPARVPVVVRFLQSRPRLRESYIGQAYLDLIARARARIEIANAYFVPSRPLLDALAAAARRGVRVTIVTNSAATNDIAPVATVSRWLYSELLAVNDEQAVRDRARDGSAITIREWQGAPFNEGTLHAKFAVFDGAEAIVGSYNLDPRSERLNSETALAVSDTTVAAALEQWFEAEYVAKSTAVTSEEAASYRRAGDLDRAFDLAFSLPLREWL